MCIRDSLKLDLHNRAKLEQLKQINCCKNDLNNQMKYVTDTIYKQENDMQLSQSRVIKALKVTKRLFNDSEADKKIQQMNEEKNQQKQSTKLGQQQSVQLIKNYQKQQ
eukprot:TRINITY_DN12996_c0_g1_i4.p1 TRINITY_DN12996_c0_g1~~TRINITY_DN12996_c0_g1_i4.p1  ORF type:complete len:108 (+),score=20.88 TRINITY_DN12996_c0_g1_i4:178-501(+)